MLLKPPEELNPGQRLLSSRGFVWFSLAAVALMGVADIVMLSLSLAGLMEPPHEDFVVSAEYNNATRLVAIGVFFELRGSFLAHLRGPEVAEAEEESFLSEVCEVFGGYLTVVGLFMELVEGGRELLHGLPGVETGASVIILGLSLGSMHVIWDMIRTSLRGPQEESP